METRFVVTGVLVLLTALSVGCSPVQVGPVQVVIDAGEVVLPIAGLKGLDLPPLTATIPFCDLPSEEDVNERVREVGGFDVRRFARISRIQLGETRFEAIEGDFNFASSASLHLTPVGSERFSLGSASAPEGFGGLIVLVPQAPIELLDLIRANDEAPLGVCPLLETRFALRALPPQATRFRMVVVIDVFAELGLFRKS